MSRTHNTAPYAIQAKHRGAPVHHGCALGRPWDVDTPCTADRFDPTPPRLARWRLCRRWTDVYGGHRRSQSAYANAVEAADRARVRALLGRSRRVANAALVDGVSFADFDDFAEMDVPDGVRTIEWDLW